MRLIRFFLEGVFKNTHTGSLFPGSRAMCRELLKHVPTDRPVRILEAGPGTGPVTEMVLGLAAAGSTLQLVELNPVFCQMLREKFVARPQRIKVSLFEGFLQDLPIHPSEPYDLVISSLPHNNFGETDLERVFAGYQTLLKPGGVLSFYEYWGIRNLRWFWLPTPRRRAWTQAAAFFQRVVEPATFEKNLVIANLPPALVRHLRVGSAH